jgi:hypothetical protein
VEKKVIGEGPGFEAKTGPQVFVFRGRDGGKIVVAYSMAGSRDVEMPFSFDRVTDAEGHACGHVGGKTVLLSGRPVYGFTRS